MSDFQIGTTLGGLATLTSLGIPNPKPSFRNYSEGVGLGDGSVRGMGKPRAAWTWGFLTQAQRDALRAFCPAASATVYIETRGVDGGDAFGVYEGVMVWPEGEEIYSGRRLDFVVEFRHLVLQGD